MHTSDKRAYMSQMSTSLRDKWTHETSEHMRQISALLSNKHKRHISTNKTYEHMWDKVSTQKTNEHMKQKQSHKKQLSIQKITEHRRDK